MSDRIWARDSDGDAFGYCHLVTFLRVAAPKWFSEVETSPAMAKNKLWINQGEDDMGEFLIVNQDGVMMGYIEDF